MRSLKTMVLGAAVLVSGLGVGATTAQAAQFGIYVHGGPVLRVPPCPGVGYEWRAGYMDRGDWMPGQWVYEGIRGPAVRYDRDDRYDGRRWDNDRRGDDRRYDQGGYDQRGGRDGFRR